MDLATQLVKLLTALVGLLAALAKAFPEVHRHARVKKEIPQALANGISKDNGAAYFLP